MKILIAGAAGFIGSHLADRLIADGHYIIGIDNLSTGQMQNIAHLQDNSNFEFQEIDVTDQLVFDYKNDAIVHMDSPASPVDFVKIPIEIIMANRIGTHNLLKFAKENNARFLFASTSECYGDPAVCPQSETYHGRVNPIGIRPWGWRASPSVCSRGWRASNYCASSSSRPHRTNWTPSPGSWATCPWPCTWRAATCTSTATA